MKELHTEDAAKIAAKVIKKKGVTETFVTTNKTIKVGGKVVKVQYTHQKVSKSLDIDPTQDVGLKTWRKLDFLQNYCGYSVNIVH